MKHLRTETPPVTRYTPEIGDDDEDFDLNDIGEPKEEETDDLAQLAGANGRIHLIDREDGTEITCIQGWKDWE